MSLLLLLGGAPPAQPAAGHFKSAPLLGLGAFGKPVAVETVITGVTGHLTLTGKVAALTQPREIAGVKGALTLTGKAPTLTQTANQSIAGVKGTLTLAGKVATVAQTANQSIAAVVGHLTATGYAPGVARTANQTIGPPEVGHLALTGQQATLSQPQSASPTKGSLSLTGRQPAVTQGDSKVVEPGKGALALAGKVPTLTQPRALEGVAGHLALGGYAPTLVQTTTAVPAFFGLALVPLYVGVLVGDRIVEPGVGHLSLAGKVATVGRDQAVAPAKGALTLTGKVARVGNQEVLVEWDDSGADEGYRVKWGTASGNYEWSADVATDVLQYEITGLTYGVTYYVAIFALVGGTEQEGSTEFFFTAGLWHVPEPGHLTLGGKAATVAAGGGQSIAGVKGNLALGGKVAALTQPQSASPAAGHLTLGGKAATVAQTANRAVDGVTGHLTLAGYAPALVISGPISVEGTTGSLYLRGHVPAVTGPAYPRTGGAGGIGSGGGRRQKRAIWIEPDDDGPEIAVESAADIPKAVKAVKRQAKAIAERALANRDPIPALPQWVVHGDAPFADELRRRIREVQANFAYVYQMMLLEQRRLEQEAEAEAEADDEDVLLLML